MADPKKKYQQLQKLFPNATAKDTIIAGRSPFQSNIAKKMQNMNAMNAAASLNNATSGTVSNIYRAKKEEKNFYDNKNKEYINAAVYNKQELKNSFEMDMGSKQKDTPGPFSEKDSSIILKAPSINIGGFDPKNPVKLKMPNRSLDSSYENMKKTMDKMRERNKGKWGQ